MTKFLAVNPTKRYSLEQIMKDKWINLNDKELKPYSEPTVDLSNPKIIESLLQLNFKMADVEQSLSKRRFDEIYAAYLLLQNGSSRKLRRSKPDSLTSIASSSAAALPSVSSPSSAAQKSETTTNGEELKETSFMSKLEEMKTTKLNGDQTLPEIAPNFKRQYTIGPRSLKERNANRLHTASGVSRPLSTTPKMATERRLQKSPVKLLRAIKPEATLTTTAQTPRRPNINVYKKVEPTTKDTPLLSRVTAANSSSSSSDEFTRNCPSRYTFHSGQSRLPSREHNTLESKVEAPQFGNGNFLQRLTTNFRLSQAKATTKIVSSSSKK